MSPAAPLATAASGPCELEHSDANVPAPRFAYARTAGVCSELVAFTLRMGDVRLFRLLPTAGNAASGAPGAAAGPHFGAMAPPLDMSAVASSAYAEIMGASATDASEGMAPQLQRMHSGFGETSSGWDDMGCIGSIELMQVCFRSAVPGLHMHLLSLQT